MAAICWRWLSEVTAFVDRMDMVDTMDRVQSQYLNYVHCVQIEMIK